MKRLKLKTGSKLEEALVVLAVNHFAHHIESEGQVKEVLHHLNLTASVPFKEEEIWEALENLYTNNNEFAILGQTDPFVDRR